MKTIFDLCKKLSNPIRIGLLRRVYASKDGGANVGLAQNGSGLGISGTSQYMKQLEELGLIRRERSGRYVNYMADWSAAAVDIAEIAEMLKRRFEKRDEVEKLVPFFSVMMNPFRARVIHWIACGGDGSKKTISDRFHKRYEIIARDLKPALDIGILTVDDDDERLGNYAVVMPDDQIARRIIELAI